MSTTQPLRLLMCSRTSVNMLLTPDEESELKQFFIDHDDNGDGMLDDSELVAFFDNLNVESDVEDIKVSFKTKLTVNS